MFVIKKTNAKKRHPSEQVLRVLPTPKGMKEKKKQPPPIIDWREQFPEKPEELQDQQAASRETALFQQKKQFKKGDIVIWIKKLWLPLLAAVIVGLAIGFTLMVLISTDHATKTNAAKTSTTSAAGASEGKTVPVTIVNPADLKLDFYGLQAGVYQNQDGALTVQQDLQKKGIQSALIHEEDYRLIIGFAKQESEAKRLAEAIKKQKIDVYSKKFSFPFNGNKKMSNSELQILSTSKSLISQVINSGIGTDGALHPMIKSEEIKTIQDKLIAISKEKDFSITVNGNAHTVFEQTLALSTDLLKIQEKKQTWTTTTVNHFIQALQIYIKAIS